MRTGFGHISNSEKAERHFSITHNESGLIHCFRFLHL